MHHSKMTKYSFILLCFFASQVAGDCSKEWKAILNSNAKESDDNGCPIDWKYFKRPSGGWCMRVYPSDITDKSLAEKACNDVNATLSGLQGPSEIPYIQSALLAQIPETSGSLWLGLQQLKKCANLSNSVCTPLTSFEWTDNSTTGTGGFIFQDGKPSGRGACAIFLVANTKTVKAPGVFNAGMFVDSHCASEWGPSSAPRHPRGYVCGKKPE